MLYAYYAKDKRKFKVFNFLHEVIPTTEIPEDVRWNDDDATAHKNLRMP
jgi:hypothetical protein